MKKTLAVLLSATMLSAAMAAPAIALPAKASKASFWTELSALFAVSAPASSSASDAWGCPGFMDADGDGFCDYADEHRGSRHHGQRSGCGWRS